MKRFVIVGTQWGDEGKGKITDYLAQNVDVVVRYQGGNNAGHTVMFDQKKHSLHLLPSGILNPEIMNVMANGMVINPKALIEELSKLDNYQLMVSDRAHVVLPYHIELDKAKESILGGTKIGTTHKGIGPTYTDKASRNGMRMSTFVSEERMPKVLESLIQQKNKELEMYGASPLSYDDILKEYQAYANEIRPFVKDTSVFLNQAIEDDQKILFEGAQGVLLCLDHGTYPYVTSSSPTAASVPLNTGIAPWLVDGAIGVTKAYTTRVGGGPLPSEITGELADTIRKVGNEFGTTTGRPRRIGWLDTVVLRHSKRVSGISYLSITLLDVLSGIDTIKVCTAYELNGETIESIPADIEDFKKCKPIFIETPGWKEDITQVKSYDDLPENAKKYLKLIESIVKVPVGIFSVGPDRTQTVLMDNLIKELSK
ncbi:MAG: adenylosuccinate synthase [Candidatus Izemoplasmatales bacterium]